MNGGWSISYEIALRWMPLDLTDEKSTLIQVMAWCPQATSHYLSQCWPRPMASLGPNELIHRGRDKMAAIQQMTVWNAFPWMKIFQFLLNFIDVHFQESKWQYASISSNNSLALNRLQAIIRTNDGLCCWHICHVELNINLCSSLYDYTCA